MNQCYFNGDFWQCVADTNPGDSPTTTPEKWVKLKLLGKWRWVLAQLTYANLLRIDGQNDKAAVEKSVAYGRDGVGLDDLIRQEANEEQKGNRCGQRGRMASVGTGTVRPVKASVILDDAYQLSNWDLTQLDTRDQQNARMALSQALQEVWERWWWRELMVCQQMPLARVLTPGEIAPTFSADYNGNVFYWALTDDYYFLSSDVNLLDPTDSAGNLNEENWILLDKRSQYAPWSVTAAFDRYECVSWCGRNYAQLGVPSSTGVDPRGGSNEWVELPPTFGLIPYWDYSRSGNPSVSTAIVGQVGPFGPIRSVSKFDPRSSANPRFYELDVTEAGTRVLGLDVGLLWVWSRRVTPVLDGDAFAATASYETVDAKDLVFDRNDQTGVFADGTGIFAVA